jgi:hypothetical protein
MINYCLISNVVWNPNDPTYTVPQLGNNLFLQTPFQFITDLPSYHFMLHSLNIDELLLITSPPQQETCHHIPGKCKLYSHLSACVQPHVHLLARAHTQKWTDAVTAIQQTPSLHITQNEISSIIINNTFIWIPLGLHFHGGTQKHSWLRHYATIQRVASLRFLMRSLEFLIDLIISATLWP